MKHCYLPKASATMKSDESVKKKVWIIKTPCRLKRENSVLALDVVLTDELLKDGAVRDIIRQCQLLRKEAGYQVEQHIAASINTADEFVLSALNEKKDYIASELLADLLTIGSDISGDLSKTISVNEKDVTISVSKGE